MEIASIPFHWSLAISGLAGLASFLSPCVLSLVPAYVGYLGGRAVKADPTANAVADRRASLAHGLAFVLGFSAVFVTLGLTTSAIGAALYDVRGWLARIGGLVVVMFGLHTMGVFHLPLLDMDLRVQRLPAASAGYLSSALMGVFFSAGWSPCVGPMLGAVLALAFTAEGLGQAGVLLAAYSLGMAVPFLLTAAGVGHVTEWLRRHRRSLRWATRLTGALMVVIGVLLAVGTLESLARYAPIGDFQRELDALVLRVWQA